MGFRQDAKKRAGKGPSAPRVLDEVIRCLEGGGKCCQTKPGLEPRIDRDRSCQDRRCESVKKLAFEILREAFGFSVVLCEEGF